jgi:hypothetical protein
MTSLEEAHHSLIIVEHDPLLYEDAEDLAEYVSQAMKEAAKDVTVLLYASAADPYFEELTGNADRVFYFEEGPRVSPRLMAKHTSRIRRARPHWRRSHEVAMEERGKAH